MFWYLMCDNGRLLGDNARRSGDSNRQWVLGLSSSGLWHKPWNPAKSVRKIVLFQINITLWLLGRFSKFWMFWAALIVCFLILVLLCDNGRLLDRRSGDNNRLWTGQMACVDHRFSNHNNFATIGLIIEILVVLIALIDYVLILILLCVNMRR